MAVGLGTEGTHTIVTKVLLKSDGKQNMEKQTWKGYWKDPDQRALGLKRVVVMALSMPESKRCLDGALR